MSVLLEQSHKKAISKCQQRLSHGISVRPWQRMGAASRLVHVH